VSVTVFGAQQYVVPLQLRASESVKPMGAFPSQAEAAAVSGKPAAVPGASATRAADGANAAPDGGSLGTQKVVGLTLGAVGIVGLGVGGVFGILTLSRVSDSEPHCQYPDGTCDAEGVALRNEARELQTKGFIAAGVGAVALAAGAYLYFTAPRSRVSVSARFNGSATRAPGAELTGALRF
jgi:serine/threonine-protein kinase